MRGGRCEGVICGRASAGKRGSPPLTIDELFERRVVGVGSRPDSGEACGSRMIPDVHSALAFEMRRLDGLLFFLDSDGLIRRSGGIGDEGGVEKVSRSGDAKAKAEAMTMEPWCKGTCVSIMKVSKFMMVCTPKIGRLDA